MLAALRTAANLDWSGWLLGIWGATISGGAGAISSGFGTMIVDPDHFNIGQGGLHRVLYVMGVTFGFSAVISLAKYLQLHPTPDQLQQALATAYTEANKAAVQSGVAAHAVADAQTKAQEKS